MAPREPGLGTSHDRNRRAALAAFRDGDPCPYGRNCKYWPDIRMHLWQGLDLAHVVDRAITGGADDRAYLAHAKCNRSAGAAAGNRHRGRRRRRTPPNPKPQRGYHNPRW